LKLFQEWGEWKIKEKDRGGKFNYDILQKLSKMSQGTSSTTII
jgi:hypothetical protein